MDLKTPRYDLSAFHNVYDPSEDSFLLLDALESELQLIKSSDPLRVVEIGSGSGVIISALASILEKTQCFATDINPEACQATLCTTRLNNVKVEIINMDLLSNFKCNSFDIIIFNPPYVVTDSSEVEGRGLNRAWAGGVCGREILDQVLKNLDCLLSENGVCYMVILKENKPGDIAKDLLLKGYEMVKIVERKIRGEHLYVYKFMKL